MWSSKTVPVVVPMFKIWDQRVCSNYQGMTLLSFLGKAFATVEERRFRMTVEPQIHEEVMLNPFWWGNIRPALYPGKDTGGVMVVWPSSLHVFYSVPLGVLWGMLDRSYPVVYNQRESFFCIFGSKSWWIFQEELEDGTVGKDVRLLFLSCRHPITRGVSRIDYALQPLNEGRYEDTLIWFSSRWDEVLTAPLWS